MRVDPPVELGPIDSSDIGRVADFLGANLTSGVTAESWRNAMQRRWVEAPNHGFMLTRGNLVVGAYLAFYSERRISGRMERFCNLGAWCVLEPYRSHGLKLVRAMLRQPDYTFTDLSPSGNVVELNRRLHFETLDTATAAVLNLPWPTLRGHVAVTSSRLEIEEALSGDELRIYLDHATAPAVSHVLLRKGQDHCHVMFRRDRRKRLPIFGSVLYVSNSRLFSATALQLSRHLLVHHGIPITLAELRVVGIRPRASVMLRRTRPKMFKSDRVAADKIDYLYSELTNVAW